MSSDYYEGSVRQYVLDKLKPLIPDDWRIEPGIPTLGVLSAPLLWVEYSEFAPLPEQPRTHIANTVDVCIVTNLTDVRKGEDAVDEQVAQLYTAALGARVFYGMTARKSVFNEKYFGWRISLTVATRQPTPPKPTTSPEGE